MYKEHLKNERMHGARTEYIGAHNCSYPPTDLPTYPPNHRLNWNLRRRIWWVRLATNGADHVSFPYPYLPPTYIPTYIPTNLAIYRPNLPPPGPGRPRHKRKRIDSERIRRQVGLHRWMDQMGMFSQQLCTLKLVLLLCPAWRVWGNGQ